MATSLKALRTSGKRDGSRPGRGRPPLFRLMRKKSAPLAENTGGAGAFTAFRSVFARALIKVLQAAWAFLFLAAPALANIHALDFDTFRLGSGSGAALVIGGIQGDEPGGFSAATLLATRYEIESGSVWVVPNLNFPSIIKRSRGLHGDMNRKFALLDEKDPEFGTVRRVQELIADPQVKLVLNLHDGSGYYRPEREDNLRGPSRWGQSVIIDQELLPGAAFMPELAKAADQAASAANAGLLRDMDKVHVHNTRTAEGDREMEKSLSYYAVRQNKAAFGLEASKELSVAERAYYHLLMIEEFLRMAGIRFKRGFELSPKGISRALGENLDVSFADNRVFLPLDNARKNINFLPMSKSGENRAITSKPIMAVLPCEKDKDALCVHYGNRLISIIRPSWHDIAEGLDAMRVVADGQERLAPFGRVVPVRDTIKVLGEPEFRVNAIGFDSGRKDESGITLRHKDFEKRFSLDRDGSLFRVEVYKGSSFAGMFLISFESGRDKKRADSRRAENGPDSPRPESSLGY